MTRGDQIRQKTDKQLARLIVDKFHVCPPGNIRCEESCYKCWEKHLKEDDKASGRPADKIPPSGTLSLREAENGKE